MPAPSYETLKTRLAECEDVGLKRSRRIDELEAELENKLRDTREELEEARKEAGYLSETSAQVEVTRAQLRKCINFFDNMVKSLDLGVSVEAQIEKFVSETEMVLNAT